MTLVEFSRNCGDAHLSYDPDEKGWHWFLDGGYSACWSHNFYDTPQEAYSEMMVFLYTFEGFEE